MADQGKWAFPAELQPSPDTAPYDLEAVLDALVQVRAEVPEDAFTASFLGTERLGNGVVIRSDGLVLTIGYLITEATTIWLNTNRGGVVPGHPLAYDQATGFGLIQPLGRLGATHLERGSIDEVKVGSEVLVAGHGGRAHSLKASVIAKREFAGYWEYVLDEAVFTAPAHPHWSGTALIGESGRLLGIGSLLVQEQVGEKVVQGNMMVPIDLLEPIYDDMMRYGGTNRPPRPWLGLYAAEVSGHIAVSGLTAGGPADRAGLKTGDVLLEVAGERITGLADFFRKVWALGVAGVEVPLAFSRNGAVMRVQAQSGDRSDLLKKPPLH